MTNRLVGKVVAVSGAGSGLGRAYAEACAAAAAAVVVNDIDPDAVAEVVDVIIATGGRAVGHVDTVATSQGATGFVETALTHFGRLGLVANAAVKHEAPATGEDEQLLRHIWEVNVLGTQLCMREALAHMLSRDTRGSIVTVVSGARFGTVGQGAYAATKGAVAALTATWALETEGTGVRVNAISPLAETAMASQDLRPDRPHLGDPSAVAPLVVALLSDASAPLTGETLRFDGSRLSRYGPTCLDLLEEAPTPGSPLSEERLLAVLASLPPST